VSQSRKFKLNHYRQKQSNQPKTMLALVRERAVVVILALALGGCRHPNDIAWSFATPRPWVLAGDSQALTPAIADDVVFFCGGYDEKELSQVYALELRTGKPKWQFGVGSCGSPPLISGGTVVAFSFAGHGDRIVVFGLDKDSGRQKWKVELPGNPHPPPPALVGDFVFFAPGSRSVLRIGVRDGSVQSFDIDADLTVAADNLWVAGAPGAAIFGYGKSYWRSRTDSDAFEPGNALSEPAGRVAGVATDGRILLVGDDDANLRAFDLGKGSVIWRHHWNKIVSAPLVADGKVFVNVYEQKYALAALTLATGDEVWHIERGSTYAPYWKDGRLYAASGRAVLVLDAASGKIQSRFGAQTGVTTTPMPGGDVILFGTARGVLYAARGR
jgi:outer membrane protein assembly factor BamB